MWENELLIAAVGDCANQPMPSELRAISLRGVPDLYHVVHEKLGLPGLTELLNKVQTNPSSLYATFEWHEKTLTLAEVQALHQQDSHDYCVRVPTDGLRVMLHISPFYKPNPYYAAGEVVDVRLEGCLPARAASELLCKA